MQNQTHVAFEQWYVFNELSELEQKLIKRAIQVREHAQAPYSKFYVGAALVTQDGNIYAGCNVERCTLTQTTHAEQNAIDTMIAAQGPAKIDTVAFVAAAAGKQVVLPPIISITSSWQAAPCGHCLQIIWENSYGDQTVKIMAMLPTGQIYAAPIGKLLPVRFGPGNLGISYEK